MKLKDLEIKNFRNIEHLKIDLSDRVTVLIGENGTGKTAVVSAFRYLLSALLNRGSVPSYINTLYSNYFKIERVNKEALLIKSSDGAIQRASDITISSKIGSVALGNKFYKIAFHKLDQKIYWENESLNDSGFYRARQWARFFALYPDRFTFSQPSEVRTEIVDLETINAFFNWDFELIKFNSYDDLKEFQFYKGNEYQWINEFCKGYKEFTELQLDLGLLQNKVKDPKDLIEYVQNVADTFTGNHYINFYKFIRIYLKKFAVSSQEFDEINDIQNIVSDINTTEIKFYFRRGISEDVPVLFNDLPSGYKRIFAIVFDFLARSFCVTGTAEPEGIVIIDEVDLHLHPTLQQEILNRLVEVFPKVQFIVTTHSPLVISRLKPEYGAKVYRMSLDDKGYAQAFEITDGIGKSYEYNLEENFNVGPLPEILQAIKDDINYFKAKGNVDKLKALRAKLQDYYRSDKLPSEFEKEFAELT